jgi:DNA-binding response OmpR family regulator
MRILIIEDDVAILENMAHYLQMSGYTVDYAEDGIQGYGLAASGNYDLIVLDLMLPRLDGYHLCLRLRTEARAATPVIMVTARDTLENRLQGFDVGADDYLIKPFALAELGARIKAVLNRSYRTARMRVLEVADLRLDMTTLQLSRSTKPLILPPTPLRLLGILMQASPSVVTRARLEEAMWLFAAIIVANWVSVLMRLPEALDIEARQIKSQTTSGKVCQARFSFHHLTKSIDKSIYLPFLSPISVRENNAFFQICSAQRCPQHNHQQPQPSPIRAIKP